MGVIHFLNVGDGDCSIIEHSSGHVTMIDICNGNANANYSTDNIAMDKTVAFKESLCGNRNQKNYPVNPIEYLKSLSSEKMIFRFILTHPDMDHLDGIKNLFDEFKISNFWDTKNNKRMNESGFGGYKKEDWDFYQKIRRSKDDITVLNLYDGSKGKYYNCDDDGGKGDYLQVLCPTKELIRDINTAHSGYNNCSYVILYNECDKKNSVLW